MSLKVFDRGISRRQWQEMTMREVLKGLEDVATYLSYHPWPGEFEIVAIHPPELDQPTPSERTVVKNGPQHDCLAEVISLDEQRRLRDTQ